MMRFAQEKFTLEFIIHLGELEKREECVCVGVAKSEMADDGDNTVQMTSEIRK